MRDQGPFSFAEIEALSTEISPKTKRPYGVQRICLAWSQPRSSFYVRKRRRNDPDAVPVQKTGPKTTLSDAGLLAKVQADLDASPFKGEGHRKVWARLRVQQGVSVSPKRVCRVMREANLLSPHRRPRGHAQTHDGTIGTEAPNVMWGTDGTRVLTVEDGYVWIFTAVEHWNSECVGWHVCKEGNRFNALQPLAMGLTRHFGSVEAGVATSLSLRMDHGTQYVSDHFQKQIKHWGITASYAFVAEPQTNGVAERFFRTLKEQAVHGRIFQNLEAVRQAVGSFVKQYNAFWLVEKRGYQSPDQARLNWLAEQAA